MTWWILALEAALLIGGATWYFAWERPRHRRRMYRDMESAAVVLDEVERLQHDERDARSLAAHWEEVATTAMAQVDRQEHQLGVARGLLKQWLDAHAGVQKGDPVEATMKCLDDEDG